MEEPAGPAPWEKPVDARQEARASLIMGGVGVGLGLALPIPLVICEMPGVSCSRQLGVVYVSVYSVVLVLMSILGLLSVAFGAAGLATGRQAGAPRWRVQSISGLLFGLLTLGAVCLGSMWAWYAMTAHYP